MPVEISVASAVAYIAMALVFAALTVAEGSHNHLRWGALRIAGLLLCLIWPLLIIGVLVALLTQDRRRRN